MIAEAQEIKQGFPANKVGMIECCRDGYHNRAVRRDLTILNQKTKMYSITSGCCKRQTIHRGTGVSLVPGPTVQNQAKRTEPLVEVCRETPRRHLVQVEEPVPQRVFNADAFLLHACCLE